MRGAPRRPVLGLVAPRESSLVTLHDSERGSERGGPGRTRRGCEQAIMPRRAVEEGREVENGHGRRRGREDYEELDRLLEEADWSLADGGICAR